MTLLGSAASRVGHHVGEAVGSNIAAKVGPSPAEALAPAAMRTPEQAKLTALGAKGWADSAPLLGGALGVALGLVVGMSFGADARRKGNRG